MSEDEMLGEKLVELLKNTVVLQAFLPNSTSEVSIKFIDPINAFGFAKLISAYAREGETK